MESKVSNISDVKRRHEEEVSIYKQFIDYLEPGSLKEKLQTVIKSLEKETSQLKKPVNELRKEKEFLEVMRERA